MHGTWHLDYILAQQVMEDTGMQEQTLWYIGRPSAPKSWTRRHTPEARIMADVWSEMVHALWDQIQGDSHAGQEWRKKFLCHWDQ